ncbi:MAG: DNA polymerase I [Bacteroidales bacterium]|nr:DNA polymerase I [Bacteroidales bacterium]
MKKLMLLDGMAIIYRAYYALNRNPRLNSKGVNTSAVLGFTNTLYDLMRQQHPTHIAVAFDLHEPTFRHEMYEPYKGNRDATPEDILIAIPLVRQLLDCFRITVLTCKGYEADDVIGTASAWAEREGFDEILMVTPDKDFAQLVTDKVHLYRFGRMGKPDEEYGPQQVCERFGVCKSTQVIDILGLWGDSIDNIPGIPGVGEKKAKQLIEQFGSIENMIAHADEIKNAKLCELVKQYADQALLSKQLATIALDAPVELSEEILSVKTPDYQALHDLFEELEFRTFAKKYFTDLSVSEPEVAMKYMSANKVVTIGNAPKEKAKKESADESQFSLFDIPVATAESVQSDVTVLESIPSVCDVAIIIDGPNIAIATDSTNVYSSLVGDIDKAAFKTLLENKETTKICFDLKALKYILAELDIQINGRIFDIQLAHYLIDAEMRHRIDFICSALLGYEPGDAATQAVALWKLYTLLESRLKEDGLEKLYYDIELPLVDVLISMESEGVKIDVDALRQYSSSLSEERNTLEHEIWELAGTQFNISSPKQLGEILYEKLKIVEKAPKTATKQYSTAEDVLIKMKDKHPIVEKILEFRSLNKLIGTYLDSFPKLINPVTGRLHTIYNQTVTATGRLSSSNPNLQNIPIRTERGREIRKAFVPRDEEHIILAADYSQIELRIIASLAKDEHMIEAFSNHYDIHAATAAKIYNLPMEEVSKDLRRNAKSVNFGIVYGISAFGLSEQLGIARKEASALIEEYFNQYPSIKQFIDSSIAKAHECGYAQTLLGRRRYLADIHSRNNNLRSFAERNAVNMPIQGTSADMIKIAMIRIFNRFKEQNLRSKMTLQVHDELVFDVFKPELEKVKEIVEQEMLDALPLEIPIEVGIEVGKNWLEAH